MHTTTGSSGGIAPLLMSATAPASVAPPAGSVKMPSVSASSVTDCRISSSLTIVAVPPVSRSVCST